MMDSVFYGFRVLQVLDDWKDALQVSRETGLPYNDVKAVLEGLVRRGLAFKDGRFYIRREGRA